MSIKSKYNYFRFCISRWLLQPFANSLSDTQSELLNELEEIEDLKVDIIIINDEIGKLKDILTDLSNNIEERCK